MLGPGGGEMGGRGLRIGGAGVDSSGSARGISEGDGSCLGVRPGMIEKGGGTRENWMSRVTISFFSSGSHTRH